MTRSVSRHFNVVNAGSLQRTAFIIDKTRQVRFSFIVEDDRLNHSMHTICNIVTYLLRKSSIMHINRFFFIASNTLIKFDIYLSKEEEEEVVEVSEKSRTYGFCEGIAGMLGTVKLWISVYMTDLS